MNCRCGCGQVTKLAPKTSLRKGWIKGEPVGYIFGHRHRTHGPGLPAGIDALYDPTDEALIQSRSWGVDHQGYLRAGFGGKHEYLHRCIMQPGVLEVDHINGNRLDNRRSNLRVVTRQENACNINVVRSSTGFLNVYPHRKRWIVSFVRQGQQIRLGGFTTPEEANQAAMDWQAEWT
jgi:hypothetical protein